MLKPEYVVYDNDPQLLVRFHGGAALRVFGSLFLATGGYLLYLMLDGIVESIYYREMLLTIPGMLLLPLMILVFGVPGWLMAVTRKYTLLDAETREVEEVKNFLVYKRVQRYPFAAFAEVHVSKDVQRHHDKERGTTRVSVAYPVELQGPDGVSVLVAEMETPEPARALAAQIAAMVGVPVNDRTAQRREIIVEDTCPDEDDES